MSQLSPRFSWPVRVLLILVLFDMFFRSTDVLYPWDDWLDELEMERMPRSLPTPEKLRELCNRGDGSYSGALDEFTKSFASLPHYWCPYPTEETLELLQAVQIGWGNLRLNPLSAKLQEKRGLSNQGMRIVAVSLDSPEYEAGLRPGDILVKINRQPAPDDPVALIDLVADLDSDGTFDLVVVRAGTQESCTLKKMPALAATSAWESVFIWIRYGLAWTASRLHWCECICNIDQEWPMFSPKVSNIKYPARARLIFADGTEWTVRQRSDPEDFTAYFRWSPGKNLAYDQYVCDDGTWVAEFACRGWCRLLTHEHPANDNGSPLKEIRLYQVKYVFPRPDQDPYQHLQHQMELTRDHNTRSDQVWTTFFIYAPADHRWRFRTAQLTINAESIE